jgi:hypothetical protein
MGSEERIALLVNRYHQDRKPIPEAPGQLPLFTNYDLGSVPVDTMREDRLEPIRREIAKAEKWNREHGK